MRKLCPTYFFFWISVCLFSCAINPQPEPSLRPVDESRMMLSSLDSEEHIVVAGQPGATPGQGQVVIRHVRISENITLDSSTQGSFSARIEVTPGDELGLVFHDLEGHYSDELIVIVPGDDPLIPPSINAFSPPNHEGLVSVSGPAGSVSVDTTVVATNLDQPSTGSVVPASDGSFAMDLYAQAGDTVAVFVVQTDDRSRASPTATAQVPEATTEDCLNLVDDDGDRLIDCDDPDCEDFCRCPSPLTFCSGMCTDTDTDNRNCGECGHVCEAPEPNCVSGRCQR